MRDRDIGRLEIAIGDRREYVRFFWEERGLRGEKIRGHDSTVAAWPRSPTPRAPAVQAQSVQVQWE